MKKFLLTVVSYLTLTAISYGKGNDNGIVEEDGVISPSTLFSTKTSCTILPVGCIGVFEYYKAGSIGSSEPVKIVKVVEWDPAPGNEEDCFEAVKKLTLELADAAPNYDIIGIGSFD